MVLAINILEYFMRTAQELQCWVKVFPTQRSLFNDPLTSVLLFTIPSGIHQEPSGTNIHCSNNMVGRGLNGCFRPLPFG